MGSAPPGHWKSLCITHLATCPNQNSPTDSADEANFYAARHAATEGVTTFDGTGSFFEATGGRLRLETAVTPKAGTINDSAVEVSDMSIDPREFRGVELNAPVPGSVTVGQQLTVAGRITTTKIDEITHVCTRWERARQDLDEADDPDEEGDDSRIVDLCDNSLAGGQFAVPFTFNKAGHYSLALYFWTRSGDSTDLVFVPTSGIITGITVQ